jgi:tRNA threonylcarbamoyladenosine modification (KEOPS) complex  Pcc1 subunit
VESGGLAVEANADVEIEAPEESVNILLRALQPEAERPSSDRSSVSMEAEGRHLNLRIRASDISALRAALNSYLRWADAILDVLERV